MFGNLDQTRMKEDQQRLIALTAAGELTASNRGLEASLCVPWPAVPRDSIGRKAADTRRGEIDRRWAETKQGSRLRLPTGRNAPIGSRQKSLHGHLNRHAARRDKRGKKNDKNKKKTWQRTKEKTTRNIYAFMRGKFKWEEILSGHQVVPYLRQPFKCCELGNGSVSYIVNNKACRYL